MGGVRRRKRVIIDDAMAVYTHLSSAMLHEHLHPFGLGELQAFEGISGGTINTIYAIQTSKGRFVVRILEDRSLSDARFEEALIAHLGGKGLKVAKMMPFSSADDARILTISPRQHLSVFEYIPGREVGVFELEEVHARQIGEFLGAMHVAGGGLRRRRRNRFSPERIGRLVERCLETIGDDSRAQDLIDLSVEIAQLGWPRHLPRGIIHGDLFIDNARFDRHELCGVLDFETASSGPLAYDAAVAIADWTFVRDQFSPVLARALLAGYQSERQLARVERLAMYPLCRYAISRFAVTRFYDFEVQKRPEAQRLYKDYRHFLQRLSSFGEVAESDFLANVVDAGGGAGKVQRESSRR